MEVCRSCVVLSAYDLVTVSKIMPSEDQYPNCQSHDQMLVRNTGSQTCWVVFLGSYGLAHGHLSFCIPPKTAQLRASASDETEAPAVRAEVWEGNRIRSRRENPQVWWEGAGWFGMHRVELCLEADANYDSHLPPSFHDFYLRACSTSFCFWRDLPLDIASQCIPPQIRVDDKELGEE